MTAQIGKKSDSHTHYDVWQLLGKCDSQNDNVTLHLGVCHYDSFYNVTLMI